MTTKKKDVAANRDALRAAIFSGSAKFQSKVVKVAGNEYEVRQPTIKERNDLQEKYLKFDGTSGVPQMDVLNFSVWAAINHTYRPGTDEKVFEDADYESLISLAAGSDFEELCGVAFQMCHLDVQAKKKPSKTSPTTS